MDLTAMNLVLAFGAGLASVLSPCVLPVLPLIVTGTDRDSRLRPLAIVGGLALAFITMGVLMSVAGSFVAPHVATMEKAAGVLVLLFGVLMLLNVNVFEKMSFFGRFQDNKPHRGLLGGVVLGASLGLVWIPCVGPMLSSVLAVVASEGRLASGVTMLALYSLGFAVPMLTVAYASQWLRGKLRSLQRAPVALRVFSGAVLILFGLYILTQGMMII